MRSLTARISLITALLLAGCVLAGGVILYHRVRYAMQEELEARCLSQIAVLKSRIEIDDGRLELDERPPFLGKTESWRIASLDGVELWSANWPDREGALLEARELTVGRGSAPPIAGAKLEKIKTPDDAEKSAAAYVFPEGTRVALRISAQLPRARLDADLRRLALALGGIGALTVLVGSALMALFIRWQLKPLSTMAREASQIGPENTGARIGAAGTSSECVLLRASLNRMVERLGAGLERERQFAAIAAHELRGPLAQLRTSLEVTLRREREKSEYRQTLEDCVADVQRLQTLAANLLLITRGFESEQVTLATVQLQAVIDRARRDCGSNAELAEPADAALSVQGREELLVAALRNVLENAARYAPEHAAKIRVERADKTVRLIVDDDGSGIAEAERQRIFDPLVRLDAARTIRADDHGFGLGLTVARAAVRACGGELACAARRDGQAGASFVFTLNAAGNG